MNKKTVESLAEQRKRRIRVAKTRLEKEKKSLQNVEGNNVNDCIYLIQHGRTPIYKIGYGNPKKRLEAMQTGNPAHLRIVRSVPLGTACRMIEKLLHKRYQEYLINNEWFFFDEDLICQVKEDFILIATGKISEANDVPKLSKKDRDGISRKVSKQFGYNSLSTAVLD